MGDDFGASEKRPIFLRMYAVVCLSHCSETIGGLFVSSTVPKLCGSLSQALFRNYAVVCLKHCSRKAKMNTGNRSKVRTNPNQTGDLYDTTSRQPFKYCVHKL